MRIPALPRRDQRANILLVTLVIAGLAGLALVSYLTLVGQQTKVTARSQSWNTALAVAEAGVEEALAHLNRNGVGTVNLAAGDWDTIRSGVYYLKRDFDNGSYEVSIQTGARPVITSVGRVPAPLTFITTTNGNKTKTDQVYLTRTVKVQCRSIGRYTHAIVAKDKVELNGKYVKVDSYHSYDTNGSTIVGTNTWGSYDTNKIRDHGDVAVIDGMSDTLSISDAQVWGKVSTGPDGNLKTNKSVSVGDVAWHSAGKKGVEDGWATDDASFDMPSVTTPFKSGLTPTGGWIGTNYYDYILASGDYVLHKPLTGKVYVQGNARLRVTGDINFKDGANDDDGIELDPAAHFELYAEGKNATFTGTKNKKKNPLSNRTSFNDDGNATNFMFFGSDNLTTLNLSKCDSFVGIVYAPNAQINLKAGSVKYYRCHVFGALMGKRVNLEKNANMHYDENIANLQADSYVIESWNEIATPTSL